jgi:hypothetical protein
MKMPNKLTLFIVDDQIPTIPEFVENSIYNSKLDVGSLQHLIKVAEWKGQHSLKRLTTDILKSDHSQTGTLLTYGFTHPSICLDEIDKGLQPDLIIYDWEYGSESNIESAKLLIEILNLTNAFVFVYSLVRNEIPPFLNKLEFDAFADRFQLFLKGDTNSSIFSSEEFILQYIVSRISKSNVIKIQGITVTFNENGYLDNPSDILHLESIFGRAFLLDRIKTIGFTWSEQNIENMLHSISDKLMLDEKRNLLITSDSTLFISKFNPNLELSFIEAFKRFGLLKIIEALEIGIVKV